MLCELSGVHTPRICYGNKCLCPKGHLGVTQQCWLQYWRNFCHVKAILANLVGSLNGKHWRLHCLVDKSKSPIKAIHKNGKTGAPKEGYTKSKRNTEYSIWRVVSSRKDIWIGLCSMSRSLPGGQKIFYPNITTPSPIQDKTGYLRLSLQPTKVEWKYKSSM